MNANLTDSRYEEVIESIHTFKRIEDKPLISVIIVTYRNEDLLRCLGSLTNQTLKKFELIIVNNGYRRLRTESLENYATKLITLKGNYCPSIARNIGILHSATDIVMFLDDDAVAQSLCLETHYNAYQDPDCLATCGRVTALEHPYFTFFAKNYDQGNLPKSSILYVEGNCSVRKSVLAAVEGFDPDIFGGEGPELSQRILSHPTLRGHILYLPHAVIQHDYANNLQKFTKKFYRYGKIYGQKCAKEKRSIKYFFGRRSLTNLIIPRFRHFLRISRSAGGSKGIMMCLSLSFLYLYKEWVSKAGELVGYLKERAK